MERSYRCPYCNKDLSDADYRYCQKHINRCKFRLNPYRYSERGRGRPTNEEKQTALQDREEVHRYITKIPIFV